MLCIRESCGFQRNVDDAYKKQDSAVSLNDNIPRDAR